MKTKTKVLSMYPEYKTVINAVIRKVGLESVEDINKYGISGGFSGFIYYTETHKFAMRYRKTIIDMLEDDAFDQGIEVIEMISHFGYFRDRHAKMDNDDRRELYAYLGGGKCEPGPITNLMAWYAAEKVCYMFDE